jgi:hypothetical protein
MHLAKVDIEHSPPMDASVMAGFKRILIRSMLAEAAPGFCGGCHCRINRQRARTLITETRLIVFPSSRPNRSALVSRWRHARVDIRQNR